jgi:hypothetical protein
VRLSGRRIAHRSPFRVPHQVPWARALKVSPILHPRCHPVDWSIAFWTSDWLSLVRSTLVPGVPSNPRLLATPTIRPIEHNFWPLAAVLLMPLRSPAARGEINKHLRWLAPRRSVSHPAQEAVSKSEFSPITNSEYFPVFSISCE